MKKTGINKNVIMLCECAVMVALATVLSLIKIEFPYGGSITICSMLPILIIGYRYKPLVGCLTGVVYGLIQMLFGMSNFAYATSWQAALMILFFDYLIAFGAMLASVLRFLCHFLSGITVWAGFADGMPVWLYSLIYNGLYMLPEFGILIVAAIALGLLVDFRSEKLGAIKRNKK